MRQENEKSKEATHAFDFSDWHNDSTCVVVPIASSRGAGFILFCTTCHCAADAEAVSTRVTYEASKKKGGVTA